MENSCVEVSGARWRRGFLTGGELPGRTKKRQHNETKMTALMMLAFGPEGDGLR